MNTSVADGNAGLGLILETNDHNVCSVKLANPADPTIPAENVKILIENGHYNNGMKLRTSAARVRSGREPGSSKERYEKTYRTPL
jgi:hypothetical protein